jgi:hypothetical protein
VNISNFKFYSISTVIILAGLYSILTTSIYSFDATDFGLVNKLPLIYWVGLTAIGILFYTSRESFNKSAIAFIFLIFFLFVIPTIIREPVWLSNSYYPYANSLKANDINFSINLNQKTDISTSYYYWPLFLFLASIVNITTYSSEDLILKIFPILTIIIISLLSYLIFRMKFTETTAVTGASLVIASFWVRQHYFGPPAISYIFFFFLLYILSYLIFKPLKLRNELFILFILFFTATLFTHLLTFLIIAFMLGSIFMLDRIKHIKNYKPLLYLTLLSGIAGAIYYLRGFLVPSSGGFSKNYINYIINSMVNSISNIGNTSIFKESSRIQATLPGMLSYYTSWIIVGLNAICIIFLLLKFILKRFNPNNILWENYSIFLIFFLACLGVMAVALTYGPHESYQRAFMFGILPLVYFTLIVLSKYKNILYLTLFIVIICNIPAQYGSDNFRTATSTQLSGNKFFSDLAVNSTATTCINPFSLYSRYYQPEKHFTFSQIGTLPFVSYNSTYKDQNIKLNNNKFLMLSNEENNFYNYYLGFDPISRIPLNDYPNTDIFNDVTEFYTSRIYDNSGFQIIKLFNTYTINLYQVESNSNIYYIPPLIASTEYPTQVPITIRRPTTSDQFFDHWEIDGKKIEKTTSMKNILNVTDDELTMIIDGNHNINAVFGFKIITEQSEGGNIKINSDRKTFKANDIVTLDAFPQKGYKFEKWVGALNGDGQRTQITINSTRYVSAKFVLADLTFTTDSFESEIDNRFYITDNNKSLPIITQDISFTSPNSAKYQTFNSLSYNSITYYSLLENTTVDEVYARGYFYLSKEFFNSTPKDGFRFYLLRLRNDFAEIKDENWFLASAGISYEKGAYYWTLYANNGTIQKTNYPSLIEPEKWYCVEIHWKQSATRGFAEIYVNGNRFSLLDYPQENKLDAVKYIDIGVISVTRPSTDIIVYADNIVISNGYIDKLN